MCHTHLQTEIITGQSQRLVRRIEFNNHLKFEWILFVILSITWANIKKLNHFKFGCLGKGIHWKKSSNEFAWWRTNRFWCAAKRFSSILSWGAKVGFLFAASNMRHPAINTKVWKVTLLEIYSSHHFLWLSFIPWGEGTMLNMNTIAMWRVQQSKQLRNSKEKHSLYDLTGEDYW